MSGISSFLKLFACGRGPYLGSDEEVILGDCDAEEGRIRAKFFRDVDIRGHYDLKCRCGIPGAYGEVLLATKRGTSDRFAIKWTQSMTGELKCLEREFDFLCRFDHPNIVKTYAMYERKKKAYVVLEYVCSGDLYDYIISSGGKLSEVESARLIRQLLEALKYLHSRGVAHCDIKPSNIMLTQNHDVKLIDFGCSQQVVDGMLSIKVGSPSYLAPEVIQGAYNERCDIWSCGVLLFVMVYGFNPFNPRGDLSERGRERALKAIMKGFTNHTFKGYGAWFPADVPVSEEMKDLIAKMMIFDWKSRPTASELLEHPLLQNSEA